MKLKMLSPNYDGFGRTGTFAEGKGFSHLGLRRQSVFLFKRLSLCYTMSFYLKENTFKSEPSIILTADVL
jgi:hypothetical protein